MAYLSINFFVRLSNVTTRGWFRVKHIATYNRPDGQLNYINLYSPFNTVETTTKKTKKETFTANYYTL